MMCAGCAGTVERRLTAMDGIVSAAVNLPARTVLVEYDPQRVTPEDMKEVLGKAGYDMVIEEDRNVEQIERRAYSVLRRKVVVSWLLAVLTMAVGMGWINVGSTDTANLTMMISAMANMIFCGRQFYTSAWRQLLHATANMDTLVAMSTGISFLFSVFNTFWGDSYWETRGIGWHTYYDASVMIITFVLTGRLLEERAKRGTASAIRSLMELAPKTARLADGDNTTDVPLQALQRGDMIEVRAGEKVPVDGVVMSAYGVSDSGAACSEVTQIDESMISGEAEAGEATGRQGIGRNNRHEGHLPHACRGGWSKDNACQHDKNGAGGTRLKSSGSACGGQNSHDFRSCGVYRLRVDIRVMARHRRHYYASASHFVGGFGVGHSVSVRNGTCHTYGSDGRYRRGCP